MKKIKVLVVDDSLVFRELLSRGLATDPQIEVVATATDPYDARDKILRYHPDVMTLDVEMPKMNGIEFLRKLMPQYPLPTIIISAVSDAVFDAINAGAVDFVTKPNLQSAQSVKSLVEELIAKVKVAVAAQVLRADASSPGVYAAAAKPRGQSKQIIAIGASTGGTEAICRVLKCLPATMPGIVIVQHIPPVFSRMFAARLNASTPFEVKEAATGDLLQPGRILIAPGDRHMKIKKVGDIIRVECSEGDKVNGHCPSVDVLFDSVAAEFGNRSIGVILTGMGYDGAKGLLAMKRSGARTIGQNESTSVVYGMPKVAYNIGAVEKQVPLDQIASMICAML
jgi:two-component system chemotaxis response regulator CheB